MKKMENIDLINDFYDNGVFQDFYKLLEVSKSASAEDIKKNYRRLAKIYHPDSPTSNEELMKKLSKAYAVLKNETSRKIYDEYYLNPNKVKEKSYSSSTSTNNYNSTSNMKNNYSSPKNSTNYKSNYENKYHESYNRNKTSNYDNYRTYSNNNNSINNDLKSNYNLVELLELRRKIMMMQIMLDTHYSFGRSLRRFNYPVSNLYLSPFVVSIPSVRWNYYVPKTRVIFYYEPVYYYSYKKTS